MRGGGNASKEMNEKRRKERPSKKKLFRKEA